MKFMKLLLARSFSEKLEVFFETFDLDKNSCFSWDEIFKICHSCLSQMFCSVPVTQTEHKTEGGSDEPDPDDFLDSLTSYFTKYIFEAVGYGHDLTVEIPFDDMRRVIKQAEGEESDLLKLFCGVDQFSDPI